MEAMALSRPQVALHGCAIPARSSARAERGFTLFELLIVLVIIAALLAVAVPSLMGGGSSTTSARTAAIAAARTTGDAVDDFRKDHGGRPPTLGDRHDWPTSTPKLRNQGPVNTYTGRPYLRKRSIEALESQVARVVLPTERVAASVRFRLVYTSTPARPGGWSIVVRDTRDIAKPCYVRGGATAPPAGIAPC